MISNSLDKKNFGIELYTELIIRNVEFVTKFVQNHVHLSRQPDVKKLLHSGHSSSQAVPAALIHRDFRPHIA